MNMNWNVSRPKLSCDDFIINPPLHPREMRSADSYDKSGTNRWQARRHCTVSWSENSILQANACGLTFCSTMSDGRKDHRRHRTRRSTIEAHVFTKFLPPLSLTFDIFRLDALKLTIQICGGLFFLSLIVDLKLGCVYSFSCNITFISII